MNLRGAPKSPPRRPASACCRCSGHARLPTTKAPCWIWLSTGDQNEIANPMVCVRLPLSLRKVDDIPHECGSDVSHGTMRFRWHRNGPIFAAEIRSKHVDRTSAFSNWRWHVDEVFQKSHSERRSHFWSVVDHEGEALEAVVIKRRNKNAAMKCHRKLMRRSGRPERIVTERSPSYRATLREFALWGPKSTGRWLKERVENSHLTLRRKE